MPFIDPLQLAHWSKAACLWEASAPKAGNVHPQASFDDLAYTDFVCSAQIMEETLARLPEDWPHSIGVTQTLLMLAEKTKQQVGKNTNLGILLLILPLAAVDKDCSLSAGISGVLDLLDVSDTQRLYEAIRLMQPGGMHEVDQQDLANTPTLPVRSVMALAQDYDLIARQYANNFADVLQFGLTKLNHWWEQSNQHPETTTVSLHLEWMAAYPDSLIGRKCGSRLAEQSSAMAKNVLTSGWPENAVARSEFEEFDTWLRADGHRRNPGTSADLVAATLFAGFREGLIEI